MSCRCKHPEDSVNPHPCHGKGYQCRKPATHCVYAPQTVSLAGVQMKVQVIDTWACDECWNDFREILNQSTSMAFT